MDAANGELAELVGLRTGTVRLAAFPSASSTLVPRLLSRMRDSQPGISVTYLESEEPEALGLLRDGLVDLAITSAFPGDRADPHRENRGHRSTPCRCSPNRSCSRCPRRIRSPRHDPVDLAGLADDSWVAGCPVCRGHLLAACEAVGVVPRIEFETDNAVAVLNLVAAGLGVALLPRLALATAAVPPGATIRATSRRATAASRSCRRPARGGCRPSRRCCARSCSSTAATGASRTSEPLGRTRPRV